MGEDKAGEEDEEQEEEPCDRVGHDQGTPYGAHEPEQADGHLVAQEVEQPEAEVPASADAFQSQKQCHFYSCAEYTCTKKHGWLPGQ